MAIYNGPIRGGTRGGRDQFKWDDVKADKDRQHYLGNSIHADVSRSKKDKYWYTKGVHGSLDPEALAEERRLFKEQERKEQCDALGIPFVPSKPPPSKTSLDGELDEAARKKERKRLKRLLKEEKRMLKKERKEARKSKKKQQRKKKKKKSKHREDNDDSSSDSSTASSSEGPNARATHSSLSRRHHESSSSSTTSRKYKRKRDRADHEDAERETNRPKKE